MRKFFVIFLVVFLMIGVIGCQGKAKNGEQTNGESTKTEQSSECG